MLRLLFGLLKRVVRYFVGNLDFLYCINNNNIFCKNSIYPCGYLDTKNTSKLLRGVNKR